jgi:hypothetical protein
VLHDMLSDAFRSPWSPQQVAMLGAVDSTRSLVEAQQVVRQLLGQDALRPTSGVCSPARRTAASAAASRRGSLAGLAAAAASAVPPLPPSSARVSCAGTLSGGGSAA